MYMSKMVPASILLWNWKFYKALWAALVPMVPFYVFSPTRDLPKYLNWMKNNISNDLGKKSIQARSVDVQSRGYKKSAGKHPESKQAMTEMIVASRNTLKARKSCVKATRKEKRNSNLPVK